MPCKNKKQQVTEVTSTKPKLIKHGMLCKIITVFQEKNKEKKSQKYINIQLKQFKHFSQPKKNFDFSHQNILSLGVLPCIIKTQLHKETKYQCPTMEFLSKISFQNHQST